MSGCGLDGESVERVVKPEVVFQLDRKVAQHPTDQPDEKRACGFAEKNAVLNLTSSNKAFV